ncbi:class I SAM-dependent methyltransferase [Candidatus Pelagibacter ubique]|jgi:2-polyprenyl-3-methyl-5-hydroxy-6-metoxy-1,4-benzoquinol methylase|nr:class I SAM-dependent methyltransferase [Candidatus Pelagibacter ubique]
MSEKKGYNWTHNQADNSFSYLFKSLDYILEKELKNKNSLLDIGCGNGYLTKKLSEKFIKVIAVDNSNSAVQQAKKDYEGNINFNFGNLEDLKISDKFDCITLIEVIEHLYSPDNLLKNISEICDENTKIIISTPFHNFIKNLLILFSGKFDNHFSPLWENGHIKFFSKNTLIKLCERNNFKIENIYYSGRFYPLSKSMIFVLSKSSKKL